MESSTGSYKAWQNMPGLFDYNKAEMRVSVFKNKNILDRIEVSRSYAYQKQSYIFKMSDIL